MSYHRCVRCHKDADPARLLHADGYLWPDDALCEPCSRRVAAEFAALIGSDGLSSDGYGIGVEWGEALRVIEAKAPLRLGYDPLRMEGTYVLRLTDRQYDQLLRMAVAG